jgi:hypothetical protein
MGGPTSHSIDLTSAPSFPSAHPSIHLYILMCISIPLEDVYLVPSSLGATLGYVSRKARLRSCSCGAYRLVGR